jgi:N-glycosidase YbiA
MIKFYGMKDQFSFLSNFYASPIVVEGVAYLSVEQCHQALKTLVPEERDEIMGSISPADAKKLGRACTVRSDWEAPVGEPALHKMFTDEHGVLVLATKDHIMYAALVAKYTQVKTLRNKLLATGQKPLVEASPTDYYWGEGMDGKGQNKLGRMLMMIRSKLPLVA